MRVTAPPNRPDHQLAHPQPRPAETPDTPATADRAETPAATPPRRQPLQLALILVAAFMVGLDFSIVNVALPSIERELRMPADAVQWVVTGYAISFGGLLILGGRAADLLGRRRMFVAGLIAFSLASLVGGLAQDPVLLIVARVVQGAGAAVVARPRCRSSPLASPKAPNVPGPSACTALSPRAGSSRARCSAGFSCSSPAGARCSWSTSRSA